MMKHYRIYLSVLKTHALLIKLLKILLVALKASTEGQENRENQSELIVQNRHIVFNATFLRFYMTLSCIVLITISWLLKETQKIKCLFLRLKILLLVQIPHKATQSNNYQREKKLIII